MRKATADFMALVKSILLPLLLLAILIVLVTTMGIRAMRRRKPPRTPWDRDCRGGARI